MDTQLPAAVKLFYTDRIIKILGISTVYCQYRLISKIIIRMIYSSAFFAASCLTGTGNFTGIPQLSMIASEHTLAELPLP